MDVAYLCDGKACKRCNKRVSHCTHTTDIKHAINFDEVGADRFMEVPRAYSDRFFYVTRRV